MSPLKLALVTRRYPPLIGGAEKVLSYLAAALAAEGADVTVVTSRVPGLPLPVREEQTIALSKNCNLRHDSSSGRLSVVRLATSGLRFLGDVAYMQNLTGWFRANRVDLAYVSMLKHDAYSVLAPASDWVFRWSFARKAPVQLVISHGRVGVISAGSSVNGVVEPQPSWQSRSRLSRSCRRPGVVGRCGHGDRQADQSARQSCHALKRSTMAFPFRNLYGNVGPTGGQNLAQCLSAAWHQRRG